ncbi:MAG: TrmH family RNA methyltransferase [bacterium]
MRSERRLARLEAVIRRRQPDLTVVMEDIHDPHNVSAVIRSCDAAGIVEVQLLYRVEKFPRIGKKSSASAGKWVGRREFRAVDQCYAKLREEGFKIYATQPAEGAVSLYDIDMTDKIAFVFGNEHRGVTEEAVRSADGIVQIPMMGMIQSLNVSVACAVTLFEALRQRSCKGIYDTPKFPEEQLNHLLKEWAMK